MPDVKIDHIALLECEEKGGVIRSVTRRARVEGLKDIDYTGLWTALELAGIPSVPSPLPGTGFEALMLDERKCKFIDEDPGWADVDLFYRHILDGSQELLGVSGAGPFGVFAGAAIYGKTRCSIQQKETNFYFDWANNGEKKQITVAHTFPDGSGAAGLGLAVAQLLGLTRDPDFPGQTIVQGGAITVPVAQRNYQFGGYIVTDIPWALANDLIATVNTTAWNRGAPRTWLCSEVAWQIVTTGRYSFSFEFQHDPDTWDPYAVFIDDRTGRPPPNLIEGIGWKQIPYLEDVDYDEFFQSYVEGWVPIDLNP